MNLNRIYITRTETGKYYFLFLPGLQDHQCYVQPDSKDDPK